MKTPLFILLMAVSLTGCGTKNATTIADGQMKCYALTTDSDTVRLRLIRQGATISGTLYYQLAGKDRNVGSLSGQMQGDTLRANYTFQSEGQKSVREVAFLAKDGGFVEGYGDVQEQNGAILFTPGTTLTFDTDRVLTKTDCPDQP